MYNGIAYKESQFLSITDSLNTRIYRILKLFVLNEKYLYVLCHIENCVWNNHFISYELVNDGYKNIYTFSLNSFDGPPVDSNLTSGGKAMIRLKKFFN